MSYTNLYVMDKDNKKTRPVLPEKITQIIPHENPTSMNKIRATKVTLVKRKPRKRKKTFTQTRIENSKQRMLMALGKSLGSVSEAVKLAGISRSVHYGWLQADPAYAQCCHDVAEEVLDMAESALFKQIQSSNTQATIFFLKTKGKHRGYVEANINVNANIPADAFKDKTDAELLEIIDRKI